MARLFQQLMSVNAESKKSTIGSINEKHDLAKAQNAVGTEATQKTLIIAEAEEAIQQQRTQIITQAEQSMHTQSQLISARLAELQQDAAASRAQPWATCSFIESILSRSDWMLFSRAVILLRSSALR